MLWGLGVSYVISGDFAGWNFGLREGGFGGLLIATVLMAIMYSALCFSLAELASIIPVAGGGFGFARRALGRFGGVCTGTAILIEYSMAPAAIVTFIGAYVESLTGVGGWPVYLGFYAVFIGINLLGAGESLSLTFGITLVALVALIIFIVSMITVFDPSDLLNIPADGSEGSSAFLPFGPLGIWAAIPYGMWFFLAVEGVPLASEEAKHPVRDVPRGLIGAISTLVVTALLIVVLGPGGGGAAQIKASADPLLSAIESPLAFGTKGTIYWVINIAGLAGLIASFFALIYAYSRQLFALSRAGYLPRGLAVLNRRHVPYLALIVPGVIGFGLSLTGQGDLLIIVAVFGACISYVLMLVSHIVLRVREPDLPRPYRTPGGTITSGVGLVLAVAATIAGFLVEPLALAGAIVIYTVILAYYLLRGRHRIVATAPEEVYAERGSVPGPEIK
jgi:ethanolamine permease